MFKDLLLKAAQPVIKNAIQFLAGALGTIGLVRSGEEMSGWVETVAALVLAGVAYGLDKYQERHKNKTTDEAVKIALRSEPQTHAPQSQIEEIKDVASERAKAS